jgi:hypothetical protein
MNQAASRRRQAASDMSNAVRHVFCWFSSTGNSLPRFLRRHLCCIHQQQQQQPMRSSKLQPRRPAALRRARVSRPHGARDLSGRRRHRRACVYVLWQYATEADARHQRFRRQRPHYHPAVKRFWRRFSLPFLSPPLKLLHVLGTERRNCVLSINRSTETSLSSSSSTTTATTTLTSSASLSVIDRR